MNKPDLSHLPPNVQQSVRTQILMQQIQQYGTKKVVVQMKDGGTGVMDEKPFMHQRDVAILKDFIELDEGCETWLVGEKYPMRICINSQRIDNVHRFKKLAPILFRSFSGNIFNKSVSLLYFYFNWEKYIEFIYMAWRDVYYPEPKYYSQPVREFYRVFNKVGIDTKLRDIFCAITEFDTAYRYRVQDIMAEFNKSTLATKKSFLEEIERLLDLAFKREITGSGIGKFRKIVPYLIHYLKINKKLYHSLSDFMKECNLDEVKSSPEDLYFQNCVNEEKDYQYRGIPAKERYEDYLKEKKTFNS